VYAVTFEVVHICSPKTRVVFLSALRGRVRPSESSMQDSNGVGTRVPLLMNNVEKREFYRMREIARRKAIISVNKSEELDMSNILDAVGCDHDEILFLMVRKKTLMIRAWNILCVLISI
jgi:hypothetical protein